MSSRRSEREVGWIGGRRFDLFFFFGSSAIAAAAGLLALALPALTPLLWWLWLGLVDGPHLFATWQRTYLDARERGRRRALLLWSLLLFAPGFLALASGSELLWQGYLGLAVLWSWHHAVRQHWGIMSVYEWHGRAGERARRIDWWFLHGTLWGLWLLYLLAYPASRQLVGLPAELPDWGRPVLVALGAAHVVALVGYGVVIAGRARRGLPTRPAWFALAQAFAVTAFGYFVIGPFEPLYPAAVTYEQQILAVAVVVGTVHGVQYLGVIAAVSRRRYAGDAAGTVAARLGRAPRLAYGLCVAASLAYLALNAARGEGPWLAWFAPATLGAKLFLALYWGLFLHHFYLDQKIWHPRVDAELRQELGIA